MAYTVDRKAIEVGGQRDERLTLRSGSVRFSHGIGYVGIAYGA
jgi:hypothetical protein